MTYLVIAPILLPALAACGYALFGWRGASAWLGVTTGPLNSLLGAAAIIAGATP